MSQNIRSLSLSVLAIILMIAIVASVVNIRPQSGMAAQTDARDLSTPLHCLAGYWTSESGSSGLYFNQIDLNNKTGYLQICSSENAGSMGRPQRFTVLSDALPNNRMVIRLHGQTDALSNLSHRFGLENAVRSDTVLTISRDGQAMIEEYDCAGQRRHHAYRYAGSQVSF